MRLDETNGKHTVLFRAPTPGWTIEYDKTVKTDTGTRVLVTIRSPDPTLLMPQVIVLKHLATPVPVETPVDVYGRVVAFGREASEVPYRKAPLDLGVE